MDKKILLSICVPTYNRPVAIKRFLDGVVDQMTDEVELVIGDDGNMVDIQNILKEFPNPNIVHFKDLDGPGCDINLLAVTNKARGEYIWWSGDDDEFLPGAVSVVLELVKKYPDISYIWANPCFNGTEELQIDLPESRFFIDRNEVLEKIVTGLGFLSATIVKRRTALSGLNRTPKWTGSSFVHIPLILQTLTQPGRFYYLRGPIINNHPATNEDIKEIMAKKGKENNRAMEVFGINFANILREFKEQFSSKTMRRVIKKSFGQTWRGVLVGWVGDWDIPKNKRWKMFKNFWMYPECYIALVLFSLPLWVDTFFYGIYKKFFSRGKWSPQFGHE